MWHPYNRYPHAGGEDLIDKGVTGHLVPIRSPEKIAEKIVSLIENRSNTDEIAQMCREKANSYSWLSYARKIIDFNLSDC